MPSYFKNISVTVKNTKQMENTKLNAATAAKNAVAIGHVSVYDELPDGMLSEHFALREFLISGTAVRHGIDNTAPIEAVKRMKALCTNVLEPLRKRFGAIRITSGYRCERVNRMVGGAATSQHLRGEAADLHIASFEVGRKMYEFIRKNLDFDQLIFEYVRRSGVRWIHVSYRADGRNRRQCIDYTQA